MKTNIALLLIVLLCSENYFTQNNKKIGIQFIALYDQQPINSTSTYSLGNEKDSLQIESIKFYISGLELLKDGETVWKEVNSFHFINPLESKNESIYLQIPSNLHYTELRYNLGVDSLTNISGVMGGDLDPTLGMYWTWQSGYINAKIEGRSNLCKTRNHAFQFHLGGYSYPYNSLQKITLSVCELENITLSLEMAHFFESFYLSEINQVMSPGKMALILSEELGKSFKTE